MVYDPKMEYYLNMLELPSVGPVAEIDEEKAREALETLIEKRSDYTASLAQKAGQLQTAALENEKYLLQLLKGEQK